MFDKIFYINLDRLSDRNDHITDLVSKLGLWEKVTRIPGIDGSKLDEQHQIMPYIWLGS